MLVVPILRNFIKIRNLFVLRISCGEVFFVVVAILMIAAVCVVGIPI